MLKSTKSSLFGDPYYGTNIKKLLFNQNDSVLVDILIDDIYVAILDFMP
nr:MAG TPA: lysozyme [Bacteriophage sp.]